MADRDAAIISRAPRIEAWHAHVYFDPMTRDEALKLRTRIAEEFEVVVGRVHDQPVGPHPLPMFQILFRPEDMGRVVPWLALNRGRLVVLVHPDTGDDLADHTKHALWMGAMPELNLKVFR
ncbi:MAG: DOPA 4,5-dioxygenase family protein [Gemmatimonas sp.]